MKLKKAAAVLLTVAVTVGLAACGSSSDGNKDSAKKDDNKLTIWAWDEAFNILAANEAKKIYAEKNPDVDVEVVTMEIGRAHV